MQEQLTSSSQSPPRLLQTPITIPHSSTDGEHDHHMPQRLVQQKTTRNDPPTYQQQLPMQPCTDSSTKPTTTNALSDEAISSEVALPRHGDEPLHTTTMNDDQASISTQLFGPTRQLTKCGLHSEQSGYAQTVNSMAKTTMNNEQ
jgi:hypothetical protein